MTLLYFALPNARIKGKTMRAITTIHQIHRAINEELISNTVYPNYEERRPAYVYKTMKQVVSQIYDLL